MTLRHFTILTFLQRFFSEFNPIYPLYALMFIEYGNLSTEEVSMLFFIWFTSAFLAEIPTGVIADKISRRNSSILGRLLLIGTFVVWYLFPSFSGFAFGFILWGIGFACTSGATDSYLFDTIKRLGGGIDFTKLYSKLASIQVLGMFCAYILATLLIPFGYELILMVSIGISLIVPAIMLCMPRDRMEHMHHRSYVSILVEAAKIIRTKGVLIRLSLFLMFLGGIVGLMEEYLPLYYSWNGFETSFVTILLSIGLLGAVVVQWFAHYFDRYHQKILFSIVALVGICLVGTSFFFGWVAAIGFYIFMRLVKLMDTSLTARLHTLLDTDARSTALSLITFIAEVVAIIGSGVLVIVQTNYNDIFAIALIGAAVALISLGFVFSKS